MELNLLLASLHQLSDINLALYSNHQQLLKRWGNPLEKKKVELLFDICVQHPISIIKFSDYTTCCIAKIADCYLVGWQLFYFERNFIWSQSEKAAGTISASKNKFFSLLEILFDNIDNRLIKSTDCYYRFIIENSVQTSEILPHNSFSYETKFFQAIQAGDIPGLLNSLELFFNSGTSGQLSKTSTARSFKNTAIAAITIYTRAAILGGVPQEIAFQLSDTLIQNLESEPKIDTSSDSIVKYGIEFAKLVNHYKYDNFSPIVKRCMSYLDEHYRDKLDLSLIASTLGISVSYLTRLFKKEVKQTISQYLTILRLKKAESLLLYSSDSLEYIAEQVGFYDQSYFCRLFRKQYHQSPLKYRKTKQDVIF